MSNLFPRFQAALKNWAKQQLAASLTAVGKLATRIHRDERSTRGTAQPQPPRSQQSRPAATPRGKQAAKQRADEFKEAVINKVAKWKSDVGKVVEALLRPGGKPMASLKAELEAAAKLLEQFGYSVTEPDSGQGQRGQRGTAPKKPATKPRPLPAAEDETEHFEEAGEDLGVYRVGSRKYHFAPDDPILTGEMIPVTSSNVHSIGFIWNDDNPVKGTLRVRFLGTNRSTSPQTRGGKGPVYHYLGVNPAVFMAFRLAASKGKFVWDRLRVRGTVSGHQFDYELAVLEKSGYVPRKATRKGGDEFFLRRTVKGKNGKTYRSVLQDEFVRRVGVNNPPPGVIAGRGAPNRGAPSRGRPNRGR